MERPQVLIIGGGAIGLNVAYFLLKQGVQDIAVLDKGPIGSGCSLGNAGLVVPSHIIPLASPGVIAKGIRWMLNPESPFFIRPRWDRELAKWLWRFWRSATPEHVRKSAPYLKDLLTASQHLTREIEAELPSSFEFQQNGLLMLYLDKGKAECEYLAQEAERVGIPSEFWSEQTVQDKLFPLHTRARGGLFFPEDAHVHPARFLEALYQYLQSQGVRFFPHTPVSSLQVQGKQLLISTEHDTFSPDETVLAAGAWSPLLVQTIQLSLPVQPAKGYSITYSIPQHAPPFPLLLTERKTAITPFSKELRFAGTLELAGWDLSINYRRVEAIYRSVPQYLPDLRRPPLSETSIWAGLRPCTPDGLPVLDRPKHIPNLTIATGHAMIGISLAAITGKLVAELLTQQTPSLPLSPLRLSRF